MSRRDPVFGAIDLRDLLVGVVAAVVIVGAPAVLGALYYDDSVDDEWPDVDVSALSGRAESMEWAYQAEYNRLGRRECTNC